MKRLLDWFHRVCVGGYPAMFRPATMQPQKAAPKIPTDAEVEEMYATFISWVSHTYPEDELPLTIYWAAGSRHMEWSWGKHDFEIVDSIIKGREMDVRDKICVLGVSDQLRTIVLDRIKMRTQRRMEAAAAFAKIRGELK